MTGPRTNNTEAEATNSIIEGFMKWITELAIKIVGGYLPWLNIWPLSAIFKWLIERKVNVLTVYEKQIATGAIISDQVKHEVNAAVDIRERLRLAIKSGDADAIRKASDEFDAKYGELVHYNGSANNVN